MADAVRALAPQASVRLKWPNDVMIGEEKVSGILVETLGQGPAGVTLAIGCGLNLVHAPEGQRRPATALARHGASVSPDAALKALAETIARGLETWANGKNFDAVRQRWMEAAGGQGETIEVDVSGRRTVGVFGGLDADGALRLTLADGTVHIVRAGDVVPGRASGAAH
jgi:BirA family biotin operon repressor/biotin-[acetyl-CoA-carboxylase] ligase